MFDAPVLLEIENRALDVVAELEVEGCGDQLVVLAERAGGDLAGRRDDRRAADQAEPVLLAGLRSGEHPSPVLIGVGLASSRGGGTSSGASARGGGCSRSACCSRARRSPPPAIP